MREFQLKVVQPAAEQRTVPQLFEQRGDAVGGACERAVDALMRQQHAAFQPKAGADRGKRLAQLAKIRQGGELIEGGDLIRHRADLAGGSRGGKPARNRRYPGQAGQIKRDREPLTKGLRSSERLLSILAPLRGLRGMGYALSRGAISLRSHCRVGLECAKNPGEIASRLARQTLHTTMRRAIWHEEFPSRRPIHGPRPERDCGDVASSSCAGGDRGAARRRHGPA